MAHETRVMRVSIWGLAATMIFGLFAQDSSAQAIKPGDKVATAFTCRFSYGPVAATTDPSVASDASISKANIFLKRQAAQPLVLQAGGGQEVYGRVGERSFEGEIVAQIGQILVGMLPGESRQISLTGKRLALIRGEAPVLKIAKVQQHPKLLRMTVEEYTGRMNKAPALGDPFTTDPLFPGRIMEVLSEQIAIEFPAQAGSTVKSAFGEGVIRDGGPFWEIVISAKRKDLVRVAGMVGEIIEVDENLITIDFGHPFGGEALNCDITALTVQEEHERL